MKKLFLLTIMLIVFGMINSAQAREIKLIWEPVDGCKYNLHYGPSSRGYDHNIQVDDTHCLIDLEPGTYYFAVTAELIECTYDLCVSDYSNEVSVSISGWDDGKVITVSIPAN